MFERKPPTLTKCEATLGDRIDLRTSGQPEEPYLLHERQANIYISHFQFHEASLEVSTQIDNAQRFDQDSFTEECRKR